MLATVTRALRPTAPLRLLRMAALSVALASIALATSSSPTFAWATSSFSGADEQLLLTLTNQDRVSAGLNALANDSYLHKEAEWRSKDMAERDYFSHSIPPNGTKVFYYMQKDGYCFKVAGENIGLSTYGDSEATTRIETAFMGSSSHRANILGGWTRIGVGAYKAADGRKLYTVLFSVPCGSKAPAATPKPAAKNPPKAPPAVQPTPVATPTPTPEPTDTPVPVTTPLPVPILAPAPSSATADQPGQLAANQSLRVRQKTDAPGPVDSLFRLLFGGIFG